MDEQRVAFIDPDARFPAGRLRREGAEQGGPRDFGGDRVDVDAVDQPRDDRGAVWCGVAVEGWRLEEASRGMVENRSRAARRIEEPDAGQSALVAFVGDRRSDGACAPGIVEQLLDDESGQPVRCVVFPEDLAIAFPDETLIEGPQDIAAAPAPLIAVELLHEARGPVAPAVRSQDPGDETVTQHG